MCKRVIRACCYKEHLRGICRDMFCIRQYLSKKKKKKEKREKNEKRDLCFIQKSYMYMYVKKSGILVCNFFCFMRFLGWTYSSNRYFSIFISIIHDRISLLFLIYLCNFVHFQYIQADNRIRVIHWCWRSLHSHDKSGFLYTRQCLWNHRCKNGISELCKYCRGISLYCVI